MFRVSDFSKSSYQNEPALKRHARVLLSIIHLGFGNFDFAAVSARRVGAKVLFYRGSDFIRVVAYALCFLFISGTETTSENLLMCRSRLDYIGETYIGQNTPADSRGHLKPRLRLRLFPFADLPLYLHSELIYDHYVRERDLDDNSPFISAGFGFRPKINKSRLYSEILYKHYMGYLMEESVLGENERHEIWRSVLTEIEFNNKFRMRIMRNSVDYILNARFNQFRALYDNEPWKDVGPSLEAGAEITYARKRCKNRTFCLENISSSILYEYCGFVTNRNSYNMLTLESGLNLKVRRASVNTFAQFRRKSYKQERNNNSVGTIVPYYNRYACGALVTVPVIEHLDLRLGAKLRFRVSNLPKFNSDRHTSFIGLEWNFSIGRNPLRPVGDNF